ncbi:type II toxin-antitoxin system RelE/ParE family toxin [Chryseosolibacter indicus]|uniref:Type II toxin-antitoxin system RelE/ParE family toxin n=1 Tax=Chryseosolibacter indicus TaxID=2782351 RepID=A0ABS5VVC8_9BACT|nr:type II toxin-antitoxin system RelE/ParE family toxin [Chryseosolibacter indicus]MBT1705387.1 type II toxin-antitoxin system RelE/ParE family toxin [Chryseosolibacter indicus]
MSTLDKPLHGELTTPPCSAKARIEAGYLLRLLQKGEKLSLPHSRPMPSIGTRWHEFRIVDETKNWRIIYRIDAVAIIVLEVFQKKTQETPKHVINTCKIRIKELIPAVITTAVTAILPTMADRLSSIWIIQCFAYKCPQHTTDL